MYYNDNNSLNFNSSIWGTDNSFFPRASEKTSKETEDLLADISYLGKSSSEDIKTNESRSENTINQGTGTSENQSPEMLGTTGNQGQNSSFMGKGNLGVYPANQSTPFNMTGFEGQNFNTSTNPLYGTYFMAQNNPSMGFASEGLSPTNQAGQSYIGAPMHPSMYGWTHYCIPHMPAYPISTYVSPMPQVFMGNMGSGQMGTQFPGGPGPQFPMVTYPDISSTGAYTLSGTVGTPGFTGTMGAQSTPMNTGTMNLQGAGMDTGLMNSGSWGQSMNMGMPGTYGFGAPMNTPGMVNPWFYPGNVPMGMNHMAIFPYNPYTSGLGPLMVQTDDLDDMDDQEDTTPESMNRGSKHKDSKKRKKHRKHCFYYNSFSNYPYYSPVNLPMQHYCPEDYGCLWFHPFLLNLDRD